MGHGHVCVCIYKYIYIYILYACTLRLLYREMRHFKISAACIGDAGAVAAALLPEALTVQRLHVAVELQGAS